MDIKKLIAGAISGFVAAFAVDIHAWSQSKDPFNWSLAFKRWVAGAVGGLTVTSGVHSLFG